MYGRSCCPVMLKLKRHGLLAEELFIRLIGGGGCKRGSKD
jgi:hypothetical protein